MEGAKVNYFPSILFKKKLLFNYEGEKYHKKAFPYVNEESRTHKHLKKVYGSTRF